MVYDGEIIGVTKRSKPKVVGDGKHNVKSLIRLFNEGQSKSLKGHNKDEHLKNKQGFLMSSDGRYYF